MPQDYGAHEQTFAIDQAENGLMYFANVTGILEFDGQSWRTDSRVAEDAFRDVEIGLDGRIYGTSKGEFGYFSPDITGTQQFTSLIPKMPTAYVNNGTFEDVDLVGEKIVFKSSHDLILYDPQKDTLSVLSVDGTIGKTDLVNGVYYVNDLKRGLRKLEEGRLVTLPLAEKFIGLGVAKIVRYQEGQLLIVTRSKGLFVYDFENLTEWETVISQRLKDTFAYTALNIQDNYFAFGSDTGGVLIIDKNGKLIQKLDESTGLPSGEVLDLVLDSDANLWVAQHGAISQIILNSPITTLDERHGVNGYVLYYFDHGGYYYVASALGIAYKSKAKPWQSLSSEKLFTPIENYPYRAWMFFEKSGDLLAATNTGLLQIEGTTYKEIYKGERLWAGTEVPGKDQMLLGSIEGHLFLFEKANEQWKLKHKIKGFEKQMDFLEWDESGDFWMTDSGTGVFRLSLNEAKDEVIKIKSYGIKNGLPDSIRNRVFRHSDGLKFTTDKGIYEFNQKEDSFSSIPEFKEAEGLYAFRFAELAGGNIYASLNGLGKGLFRKNGGNYKLDLNPFQRIDSHNSEYSTGLGTEDIWITSSGIKHIDTDFETLPSANFKAKIREVRIATNLDSVIFGGAIKEEKTLLPAKGNALHFSYSASFYDALDQLQFQSFLEGGEDGWSNWSSLNNRTFTNLPHGRYTFRIRAKNLYGQISEQDQFSFTIETPWFLTYGAYASYLTLLALSIWLFVRVYNRKLIAEKETLEKTILDRTTEIRAQKELAERDKITIQAQADKLKELDKVKSRFFANISHELRTPLTLINAPLESLIEDDQIEDPEVKETLQVAQQNGKRLLSLVEEILDLAKLEAGKLTLVENPCRLKEFVEDLLIAYKSAALKKNIDLKLCSSLEDHLTLMLDEKKCGKVMHNLLSNALKYTPEGGVITVEIRSEYEKLFISVTDSGLGIHPNDLPRIFDRFYQSEQPGKKAEGGTGIGLALAKELAMLHGGELKVESTLGEMTRFTFTLPIKIVAEEVLVPLNKLNEGKIESVLKSTIDKYKEHFNIDMPVLLVTEDHPEMRAFVAKTLQPYFLIREAENGQRALEILNSEEIDIVISDVMMPIMDGFELLEAIKANKQLRDVSIVMLTARADTEDKLQALTLGIDDYLTKPFSAAEFLARIKNILDNRIKIIRQLRKLETSMDSDLQVTLNAIKQEHDLTDREVEILELLSQRFSNQMIADNLFVSTNTVKYHLKGLYFKLGVTSRAEVSAILNM